MTTHTFNHVPLTAWRGPTRPDLSRTELVRLRLAARLTRCTRWEFWPSWLIYAPLAPWLAWLAVRHRGLSVFTAANPGIALGGVVGESKWQTLSQLPRDCTVPTSVIEPAAPDIQLAALARAMSERRWEYPIVMKPDVGERGAGVRLAREPSRALAYFEAHPGRKLLAQPYHPGPFEAGIFYVREPGRGGGFILSMTDKVFPTVTGDGCSTLRTLIWRHSRLRAQAEVFLRRLSTETDRVPARGEVVQLAVAGNHCQGTLFCDGADLATPELTAQIDRAARTVDGFYFGRFDVRYTSREELKRGTGFQIVELNGVLSESTNIYDPTFGFWAGQRLLRRQWGLAFRIGAINRAAGHPPSGWARLLRQVRAHHAAQDRDRSSD